MRNRTTAGIGGFTVIELMIAVAILAILAAVAIPIYSRYSDRTYRSEAMADLLDCAQALERRASVTFSYTGAQAGGGDGPGAIDPAVCDALSVAAGRYNITYQGDDSTFTLTANPTSATWDDGRMITLNSAGQRGWDESDPPDGDVADANENNWEED
ncbi:MAG: type IV pilin protein [Gammaproteobacteria bacterium]